MSTKRTYIRNEQGHFVCPHCGEIKVNQNTMFYHLNKHEGNLPHECPECKKGFVQKQELLYHIAKWHPAKTKEVDICCPFPKCSFKDIRKGNVRTHCMRKHIGPLLADYYEQVDGAWNCHICSMSFKAASGFYYHLYNCLNANKGLLNEPNIEKQLRLIE